MGHEAASTSLVKLSPFPIIRTEKIKLKKNLYPNRDPHGNPVDDKRSNNFFKVIQIFHSKSMCVKEWMETCLVERIHVNSQPQGEKRDCAFILINNFIDPSTFSIKNATMRR